MRNRSEEIAGKYLCESPLDLPIKGRTIKSDTLSRTTATSKIKLLLTLVNFFQPLTNVKKSFIIDVAVVRDTRLQKNQINHAGCPAS